jgi:hypothetical protein
MPVDHVRMTLKPNSFFSVNPSLDVPGGKDEKACLPSVLLVVRMPKGRIVAPDWSQYEARVGSKGKSM